MQIFHTLHATVEFINGFLKFNKDTLTSYAQIKSISVHKLERHVNIILNVIIIAIVVAVKIY